MTARIVLAAACACAITAGSAFAQQPATPTFPDPATIDTQVRLLGEKLRTTIQALQQRGNPQPPTPPTPPTSPRTVPKVEGQSVNVKVEFVITDQRDGSPALKKTVSATVADGNLGSIRSETNAGGFIGAVPLNIDATPTLLSDGKIRLQFMVQYDMSGPADPKNFATGDPGAARGTSKTTLRSGMTVILESGKAMLAAQSADPVGERQVMVEVKATILK